MVKKRPKAGISFYLGMIVFFYFCFDLTLNDYPWPGILWRLLLALAGLLAPLWLKMRREKRDGRE